ncbi:hypothetical protein VTN31DRAFT_3423 [Thermomyces dupontii]|uniref:uncharacterized protein n=1 Tax=Talaromyces thermophilus TaxID=28565 RepID=UPI0037442076
MQAADKNPGVGRLQHHLAVLSRPNILQQLFYYSKSLVSVEPFTNARSSIQVVLFRPLLRPEGPPQIEHFPALLIGFVTAHGVLFTRGMLSTFLANARFFLQNLDSFIGQVGAHFREQGAQISLISIAAIFDFGQPDARIPKLFDGETTQALSPSDRVSKARVYWEAAPDSQKASERRDKTPFDVNFKDTDQVVSYASFLAFSTLRVVLSQSGNNHILPALHVYLAFLWAAALVPETLWFETDIEPLRRGDFPMGEAGTNKQLPEDFYIRGYSWSRLYYPQDFFVDMPDEEARAPHCRVGSLDHSIKIGSAIRIRGYTKEEMCFVWYYRVDLGKTWKEVQRCFNRHFYHRGCPGRSIPSLQAKFYRFIKKKKCPTVLEQRRLRDGELEGCRSRNDGLPALIFGVFFPMFRCPGPQILALRQRTRRL